MDPLSIIASSLALITAAKATCDFIAKVADAPKALKSAKDNTDMTISIVQALKTYLSDQSESALSGANQLLHVLDACTKRCDTFQVLLRDCSKHSVDRTDGKLSLRDRGKLVIKEKELEDFRKDMACFHGALNVAAIPLLLSGSATSGKAMKDLTEQMNCVAINVVQHLESIRERIEDLELAGVTSESGNGVRVALGNREAAFAECQKLIEESAKAAKKNDSFKAAFGDLVVDTNGMAFEGIATDQSFRVVNLGYKDARVGRGAVVMRGLADPEAMKSFFATATAGRSAKQSTSDADDQCHDEKVSSQSGREASGLDEIRSMAVSQPLPIEGVTESNLWAGVVVAEKISHQKEAC